MTEPPKPSPERIPIEELGKRIAENLNRNVRAEHEADLASLPPEVRESRTPEEWWETPPLEILLLACDDSAAAPATQSEPNVIEGPIMSDAERPRRLGLSHLANDPVALRAELERRTAEYGQRVAEHKAPPIASLSATDEDPPRHAGVADDSCRKNILRTNRRGLVTLMRWWLALALVACVLGAAHDGVRSIVPNLIRYGLGIGLVLAVLFVAAYFGDAWLLRRKGLLNDRE